MTYEIKDSGARKEFEGGMQRDTAEGKPHPNYFDWALFIKSGCISSIGTVESTRTMSILHMVNIISNLYSNNVDSEEKFGDINYYCEKAFRESLSLVGDVDLYNRINAHMELGAKKYSPNNWRKCVTDAKNVADRAVESMMRHAFQFYFGETDEDHLAAMLYNVMLLNYCLKYGQTNTAE